MTRPLPFSKPTCFVDRSKAWNTIVLFGVSGSFLFPSVTFVVEDRVVVYGGTLLECGGVGLAQINVHECVDNLTFRG